jgi:hypothetical protein
VVATLTNNHYDDPMKLSCYNNVGLQLHNISEDVRSFKCFTDCYLGSHDEKKMYSSEITCNEVIFICDVHKSLH